jgi:hypothetical protein
LATPWLAIREAIAARRIKTISLAVKIARAIPILAAGGGVSAFEARNSNPGTGARNNASAREKTSPRRPIPVRNVAILRI